MWGILVGLLVSGWMLVSAQSTGDSGAGDPSGPTPVEVTSQQHGQATLGGPGAVPPPGEDSSGEALCAALPAPVPTSDGSTVLQGQVLLGPISPVDRPGVCNARPYAATLSIQTPDGSREISRVTADAQGMFSVALDPGEYLLVPQRPPDRPLPAGLPQAVMLDPGMLTSVVIHFDSGIR